MLDGIFSKILQHNVFNEKEVSMNHYGAGSYVITVGDTILSEYQSYKSIVEACGFAKYAGDENGLDNAVFCSTYWKEGYVLTLSHFVREKKTNISFYQDMPLSDHLLCQNSYMSDNEDAAKTKIHMLELRRMGNSFIFQLKNGHFLISDGGMAYDLPYLLDYLEGLTPVGVKPIIEAWVISHAHDDHCGALNELLEHSEWRERIFVDGIYFSEPGARVTDTCGGEIQISRMKRVARCLRTTKGDPTPLYRPQTGQRYYFDDITMDILITQEQIPFEKYYRDLNTSSTVCLFTIEGQKCFFSGDIHEEGLDFIMKNYSREYLELDLFTLNHHGYNTSVTFSDYISVKTLLVTLRNQLPVRMIRETKYFISKVQETMVWGDGTKILTFPYEIGSFECLPCNEWIYHQGVERILQSNLYTFPNKIVKGFIFYADEVLFDGKGLKAGVIETLEWLKKRGVHMSVYSARSSQDISDELQRVGIQDYFELITGYDTLDEQDPYTHAIRQSEIIFQLDHIHKYVVVCRSEEVVEAAIQEGVRTLVVTDGKSIDEKFKQKCWKCIDSLRGLDEIFTKNNILFE